LLSFSLNPDFPAVYAAASCDVATGWRAWQSSTDYGGSADRAVDGNTDTHYFQGQSCSHTEEEPQPWLAIDMGEAAAGRAVKAVTIYNRADCCSGNNAAALARQVHPCPVMPLPYIARTYLVKYNRPHHALVSGSCIFVDPPYKGILIMLLCMLLLKTDYYNIAVQVQNLLSDCIGPRYLM
jgi:hypothetical protein